MWFGLMGDSVLARIFRMGCFLPIVILVFLSGG
jgi:hypothetical protein